MSLNISQHKYTSLMVQPGQENTHKIIHGEREDLDEIRATILSQPEVKSSEKILTALGATIKVFAFPITLLIQLIVNSLSRLASSHGLGTSKEVRSVDSEKRKFLSSMGGESVKFGMEKGSVLEGMFFTADLVDGNHKDKTILLCTGSHQSYEHYAIPMVNELKAMGHNVLVFNYEGFGQSEGEPSEQGVYRSVEAAYQYLRQKKNCPDESIVAWGYSLGSGAVADLATNHRVDVVIDRGFSSMSEVAYQQAPQGLKTVAKVIFMVGAYFNNLSKLRKAQGKIAIAQGASDTTMNAKKHGQKLKEFSDKKSDFFYREVDSNHFHRDDRVWFSEEGEDRQFIKNFLNM